MAQGFTTGVTSTATGTAGGDLSGTYPNPSVVKINGVALGSTLATAGNLLIGSGTNWVTNAITGDIALTSGGVTSYSGIVPLSKGGTNKNITADNGAIVYSNATQLTLLASTATANKLLCSGASGAPTWSTPTFPNASAISRKIIVSDGTDWVASTETYATPGASGNVLTSDGTNWTSAAPAAGVSAATQADQETSTSTTTYVSPGRQQYHPSAAKGWCQANVSGSAVTSYNVTSVTDGGTGIATINWAVSFSTANACHLATSYKASAVHSIRVNSIAAGSTGVVNTTVAGTPAVADPDDYMVATFGDFA